MARELETRTVFIDTSFFVSQNFAFGGERFTRFKELRRTGKLRLVLPDVTVREIEARMDEKVNRAVKTLNDVKSDVNVLRPLELPGLREMFSLNRSACRDSLKEMLHNYLEEVECEVVKVDGVSPGPIFDLYFEKRPPFGEGKKKDEFPDAFALAALQSWREKNGGKVYVVSEDRDMASACAETSSLIHVADLSEVLELALKDQGLMTQEAHDRFSKVRSEVQEKIRAAFEIDLYVSLMDEDGDAEKVKVEDVRLYDESVVWLSDGEANYTLSAEVNFLADIRYPDPNFVAYDSETGTVFYYDFIETTVSRSLEVPVEVTIEFDQADLEANEVAQVTVNNGDTLWIYAEDDE